MRELDIFIDDLPETALDIHTRVQDLISDKRSKKVFWNAFQQQLDPTMISKAVSGRSIKMSSSSVVIECSGDDTSTSSVTHLV